MSRIKVKVEKRHFERSYDIRVLHNNFMNNRYNDASKKYREFMGEMTWCFAWDCLCPIALALKEDLGIKENDLGEVSVQMNRFNVSREEGGKLTKKATELIQKVDTLLAASISKEEFLRKMKPVTLQLELN